MSKWPRGGSVETKSQALLRRIKFWLSFPGEVLAYKRRERAEQNKITPTLWLSPAQIISMDLELYATDEGKEKLDLKLLDDLAKSRDEALSAVKRQTILTFVVFLFLLANYLSIKLDMSVGGFSLKYEAGIPEGLLLLTNLMNAYTLIVQSNVYVLESAMKFLIGHIVPLEMRQLYYVRYFTHENYGSYYPTNLPHITPKSVTSFVRINTGRVFIVALIPFLLLYFACYAALAIDIWQKAALGIWSKLFAVFFFCSWLYGLAFAASTRFKMPYRDYTINHELELLQEHNPERHRERLHEVFGQLNADRRDMEERGYLKPRRPPQAT